MEQIFRVWLTKLFNENYMRKTEYEYNLYNFRNV